MPRPLIYFWLFLCVHSSYAQQYLFERYTPKDGLVNNRVRFFFQDSWGRLYISTYGGLSVYDGSRFINYTTQNGLEASLVNDIMEMGEDSLWIVPNGPALHCLVHGEIRNIATTDGFYPVINQLLRCSDGFLYAIADEGLFRFEKNRFVRIMHLDSSNREADRFFVQAVESNRRLYLLNDPNLGLYPRPGALLVYDLDTHQIIFSRKDQAFYGLARSPLDQILVSTAQGIRIIDKDSLKKAKISTVKLPSPYEEAGDLGYAYLCFDREGTLWVSTDTAVVGLSASGEKTSINASNGLPPGVINAVLQDKENNIWFANDRNGIVKLSSRHVLFYPRPRPGFTVSDLFADERSDSLWMYDARRHQLLLLNGKRQELFRASGTAPSAGRIYIGQHSWLVAGNRIYALHFLPGHRFGLNLIHTDSTTMESNGIYDRQGRLVLAGVKLTVLVEGKPVQIPLHYLSDQVAIDDHDRIWTCTRSNDLAVYGLVPTDTGLSLKRLAHFPGLLPHTTSRSLAVDHQGRVWLGTRDHGLYCLFFDDLRLISWRQLTVENGLAENFVRYLLPDTNNSIWACTPGGLNRIRFRDGHFTTDDLTHTNDNYQNIFRIAAAAHGVHWALVKEGFMKIGPLPPEKNSYQPHLLFSRVEAGDGRVEPGRRPLILPYDRNAIAFSIGVTSFINEAVLRYSWMLEGSSHPSWSLPSDRSAINLVNLPPGRYTLRVRAGFLNGDYPDLDADYPFVIQPPWWQTAWFRVGVALILVTITLLGIRAYIRRRLLHQRLELENQQAIERERTRIATDMHDDLGAGLSRIKFLSETIGIKRQQQLPIEEEITGIRRYSHEMIDKMGEIVWALNERNDSLSDLLSYARSYAAEYLLQAGIRCQVEAPPELPSCFVSGEFRRNVYLTIKEALHNIVKHAQAEQVKIRMIVHPGKLLLITIEDDGIGFNQDCIRPFANGLNNMHQRIAGLGGSLFIYNAGGTTIRLSVPL
ncbi:MAG TPA: two-component regulator propeller domain-containing protein [Puia sp.]|nr:two-component regulator propeller domain-containing protein [Puia sp.]